ncbi:MAG TPA: tRNA (adenosine(37)-N6)-threonylcarbamoyltransferase complex ATPase subunit type 1 TsaE [Spirochaetota bacterium]|nr:tRNA (adenosine(37)-N6)-threonylcarbamoyltransferase complex ATPase subunit type 1 TsaE [Spirochaetota bacterium]
MTREHITTTESETFELGVSLGSHAARGDVFAITGDLGAGKTVLAKGIAKGMGVDDEVTSPTFSLLEIYERPLPLYHFDLYRIERTDELDHLCFEEYWEGDGVSVIEWAERAAERLPANAIRIVIRQEDAATRRICIEHPGH